MIRSVALTSAILGSLLTFCHAADDPKNSASVAERYREIVAEYESKKKDASVASNRANSDAEQLRIYEAMMPDDSAFSRRMVDLAASSPKDPASRDALIWVIHKPYRLDVGEYGDQVGRAVRLLVDEFADDPEAARLGLGLDNSFSRHRDALMEGMYANAEGRETKGLSRLAFARYLQQKAAYAQIVRKKAGKESMTYNAIDDDGQPIKKTHIWPNEIQGYIAGLRMVDPDTLRKHAEALYGEVRSDYGDIPYTTLHHRDLEAVLKSTVPMWNDKPMTAEDISKVRSVVEKKKTLAQVADANLDELHQVNEGQVAPEIEGKDLEGKPMRLSDFRGKVIVLVFWGSWCGPCLREVPFERELAEKYRGKPFAILGVNCSEKLDAARKAVEREGMTWPHWHDGEDDRGPIVEKYHVRTYPTTLVIDAKGVIRRKNILGAELDKAVDDLMKNKPGSQGDSCDLGASPANHRE